MHWSFPYVFPSLDRSHLLYTSVRDAPAVQLHKLTESSQITHAQFDYTGCTARRRAYRHHSRSCYSYGSRSYKYARRIEPERRRACVAAPGAPSTGTGSRGCSGAKAAKPETNPRRAKPCSPKRSDSFAGAPRATGRYCGTICVEAGPARQRIQDPGPMDNR